MHRHCLGKNREKPTKSHLFCRRRCLILSACMRAVLTLLYDSQVSQSTELLHSCCHYSLARNFTKRGPIFTGPTSAVVAVAVCRSVRPPVCHEPVLYRNGSKNRAVLSMAASFYRCRTSCKKTKTRTTKTKTAEFRSRAVSKPRSRSRRLQDCLLPIRRVLLSRRSVTAESRNQRSSARDCREL